jgi:peptidoglycan hydrolase-like protein with peptidoglycan-binding domain
MDLDVESIPFDWVRDELRLDRPVSRGDRGRSVQRIQEWLTLNGVAIVVDRRFGPATEYAVRRFQGYRRLPRTGVVDETTFLELAKPLRRALAPPPVAPSHVSAAVAAAARQHRRERPREVGGANRGPWVRLYMNGRDGDDRLWCAGFVSFLVRQAAWHADLPEPIRGSASCDSLSQDARSDHRFIPGAEVETGATSLESIPRGSFFVQRRSPADWNHVGVVISAMGNVMETIEGNTNDGGSREGTEVCRRIRGLENKDFITLQPLSG